MSNQKADHKVISRGGAAGESQAFPDVCRLANGDLFCVFYAGYGHISLPNEKYPKGGRICMVRSGDEGRTWSAPAVLFDSPEDDRDPHIAQLQDGRVVCTFFDSRKEGDRVSFDTRLVWSSDGGRTWSRNAFTVAKQCACSAPVREIERGLYLLGIYREEAGGTWAAITRSRRLDQWETPLPLSKNSSTLPDGTETDVIRLQDGKLLMGVLLPSCCHAQKERRRMNSHLRRAKSTCADSKRFLTRAGGFCCG